MAKSAKVTPGQLTKDVHLVSLVKSETARKANILEQYHPSDEVVDNLEHLAKTVIQPLIDILSDGLLVITSGYRCKRLNESIGGSEKSQHMTGQAVDLQFVKGKKMENDRILKAVIDNNITFDQMIIEKSWIHISCKKQGNRFQRLDLSV